MGLLPGATDSRKARGTGSRRRAFRVTSCILVGLLAASVISAVGGGDIFWAAGVCAGVSMWLNLTFVEREKRKIIILANRMASTWQEFDWLLKWLSDAD